MVNLSPVFRAPVALLGCHIKTLRFCSPPGSKLGEKRIPEDEAKEYRTLAF